MVTTAYVLIDVTPGKTEDIIKALSGIQGIKSAHVVFGPYDIIAFVEVADVEELSKVVYSGIHNIEGVTKTVTCHTVELS